MAKFDAELQIALEQMKLGGQADLERVRGSVSTDVERAKLSLKNEPAKIENSKIDAAKTELTKILSEFSAKHDMSVKQLTEMLNAPREIVRGKDGRVSGVKIGGVERKLKRDNDGKVTGLQ